MTSIDIVPMGEQLSFLFEKPIEPVDAARAFQDAFGAPSKELAIKLVQEELKEMAEAIANLLKEMADVIYTLEGAVLVGVRPEDLDENTRHNLSVMGGYMKGTSPDILMEAFRRVHESNMSKLGIDGKPVSREDGKILKSPNYKEPYLMDLV